ncbi:uncharacterized protein [Aristolochia californica]|uniref:uncharacterized protein isoform X2 n=1 Tax=Aristolochia californica TaxID=171875 RepID=UPI0035E0710A
MRIRKRSMLPFSLSSSPRMASDLFCLRGASVQKPEEAEDGDMEEAQRGVAGAVRGPGEGELGEGGFDQRIDRGSTGLPSRRADNGPFRGGVCDRADHKCVEEVNQCCMLSAPILAPVEAYRDAEEERCSAREKGNNGRNGSTKPPSAETSTDGRWEEREKVIPLKKRKGSLEWGGEATAAEKQKKVKTKTKRPTKKKVQKEEKEEEKPAGAASEAAEVIASVGKKGRRGNNSELMEGSRCSRINGRGWRCCQQTLVGYSLCEHHLGKGRLRSMNSFPSRPSSVSRPAADPKNDNAGSSDKSEAQTAASKGATKKKIGMVKARSISSLLGLSTAAILSTDRSTTAAAAAAATTTTAATATSS